MRFSTRDSIIFYRFFTHLEAVESVSENSESSLQLINDAG